MLTLHHIGILVKDLDAARIAYREIHPKISEPIVISSQNVRVCFVETGGEAKIELVEPFGTNSVVQNLIKRNVTYYHLGYTVLDFQAATEDLTAQSYHHIQTFQSEAFGNRRCAFFMSPLLHLIEIIEDAPPGPGS
jgi:methylmalonyl-CoA/ethylmalonyl-CoA epimerase